MSQNKQIGPPPNFRDYLASAGGNYYIRGDRYGHGWFVHAIFPNWEIDFYATPFKVTTATVEAWHAELISQYREEYRCLLTGF